MPEPICTKRLQQELLAYQRAVKKHLPVCYHIEIGKDLQHWVGWLLGPIDTPYEGGKFKFKVEFPANYPIKPPNISFITNIYHPNISSSGRICLDILGGQWAPCLTLEKVMLSLSSLLMDGNPESPLNSDAASKMKRDPEEYAKIVHEYVMKYAME
ncbi:Ubiquitin-conjugating enzyme E2 [Aduncisulcus paluster]|uniref:Ubiquitin-conjugating enzyme E2 n=1 Tax=Aduncisulcus paluster TaxID=2918883 RepID=A0ABQ5KQY8_9EUKA|nr:Ubiquitin-conjugating enzyme E2 [Aduncisulcus paluster]